MASEQTMTCNICNNPGPNYFKLKRNLTSFIAKLQNLKNEKIDIALKHQKHIEGHIYSGQANQVKNHIEYVAKEYIFIKALETLQNHCNFLMEHFQLINQLTSWNNELDETMSSIIWADNHLDIGIIELNLVSNQLIMKHGKFYAKMARSNFFGNVSKPLINAIEFKTSLEDENDLWNIPSIKLIDGQAKQGGTEPHKINPGRNDLKNVDTYKL